MSLIPPSRQLSLCLERGEGFQERAPEAKGKGSVVRDGPKNKIIAFCLKLPAGRENQGTFQARTYYRAMDTSSGPDVTGFLLGQN